MRILVGVAAIASTLAASYHVVAPGMTEFYQVTERAGEVFHDNQEYRNHTTGHSVRESGSYGAMLEGRNPETDSGY
jgi:hypothetical protein